MTDLEEKLTSESTQRILFSICFNLTGDVEAAKDLRQTVCFKAWRAREQYDDRSQLNAWLGMIARNEQINRQRKDKNRCANRLPLFDSAGDGNFGEYTLECEDIMVNVRSLPGPCRESIELRMKGLSYDEIAKATDAPLGTCKSRIHFGRNKLMETFKKKGIL